MPSSATPKGVGVFAQGSNVFLFSQDRSAKGTKLFSEQSHDGLNFDAARSSVSVSEGKRGLVDPASVVAIHIATLPKKLAAVIEQKTARGMKLAFATGADVNHWAIVASVPYIPDSAVMVSGYQHTEHTVCFTGGKHIGVMESKDLKDWTIIDSDIMPEASIFASYTVAWAEKVDSEIVLLYVTAKDGGSKIHYAIHWAAFSPKDPSGLLRKSDTPIWESPDEWEATLFAVATVGDNIISYWNGEKRGVFAVSHGPFSLFAGGAAKSWGILTRAKDNPILRPIAKHFWESKAVFNPGAVFSRGKVHLIYRAIGDADVSVLGYAAASDGVHIDARLPEPAYKPREWFEMKKQPGYSGCEDPRLTIMDGRIYMLYTAYTGEGAPRVAISSIKQKDFVSNNWQWEKPKLISPPGIDDKNACLLSEKIKGNYIIFHRFGNSIWVDELADLNFGSSHFLSGSVLMEPRATGWDSEKIGIGGPPIKTDDGWLLIYHGLSHADRQYRLGAALLAPDDPVKVIARLDNPILEPETDYENMGVRPGTVFACGNVVIGKNIFVYYGGADQVVCGATIPLASLLSAFKSSIK